MLRMATAQGGPSPTRGWRLTQVKNASKHGPTGNTELTKPVCLSPVRQPADSRRHGRNGKPILSAKREVHETGPLFLSGDMFLSGALTYRCRPGNLCDTSDLPWSILYAESVVGRHGDTCLSPWSYPVWSVACVVDAESNAPFASLSSLRFSPAPHHLTERSPRRPMP